VRTAQPFCLGPPSEGGGMMNELIEDLESSNGVGGGPTGRLAHRCGRESLRGGLESGQLSTNRLVVGPADGPHQCSQVRARLAPIPHRPEAQALGRSQPTRRGTIASADDPGHLPRSAPTPAHLHEGADDRPDHLVAER